MTNPVTTPDPAAGENARLAAGSARREAKAAKLREANKTQLVEDQKARNVPDAQAAADASVLNGVTRDEKTDPAKPARRPRKPTTHKATVAARTSGQPTTAAEHAEAVKRVKEEAKAESNGSAPSARDHNQKLARDLIDCVAARFSGASLEDQVKIANWLKVLPTGGAAWERYWPEGFARPTTSDWRKP